MPLLLNNFIYKKLINIIPDELCPACISASLALEDF